MRKECANGGLRLERSQSGQIAIAQKIISKFTFPAQEKHVFFIYFLAYLSNDTEIASSVLQKTSPYPSRVA